MFGKLFKAAKKGGISLFKWAWRTLKSEGEEKIHAEIEKQKEKVLKGENHERF